MSTNVDACPESDVCTDSIVISFFDAHPEYNKISYAEARIERYLGKAEKLDVAKRDPKGVVRTVKETTWWAKHVVTFNETAISWCDKLYWSVHCVAIAYVGCIVVCQF